MRGFDSRPRYEGWQRARAGTDGEALQHIPVSFNRQDAALLRQLSGFESLRRSQGALAQLASAPPRQGGRCRFESGRRRHVRVAQQAERQPDTLEAAGSDPAADTTPRWRNG